MPMVQRVHAVLHLGAPPLDARDLVPRGMARILVYSPLAVTLEVGYRENSNEPGLGQYLLVS